MSHEFRVLKIGTGRLSITAQSDHEGLKLRTSSLMTEAPPEFVIAADEEGGRCGQLIRTDLLEAFEAANQGGTRQA